jgi:hypothetical protein
MPVPLNQDIAHYRGDTLSVVLRLWEDEAKTDPADLAAATVTAQVRATATSATAIASFDVAVAGNMITLTLLPEQAQLLPTKAVYDCQVDWTSDATRVQTVVAGKLTAAADVTRADA